MADVICPFLGMYDDADTALAYPSPSNRCYRPPKPASVSNPHQDQYCLSGGYNRCPIFQKYASVPISAAVDDLAPQLPATPVISPGGINKEPTVQPERITSATEMFLTPSGHSSSVPLSAVESSEFGPGPTYGSLSNPIPSSLDPHITDTQPMRPGAWLPDRVQPIQEIPLIVQKPPRRWLPVILVGLALLVLLAAVLWWVFTALQLNWNGLGASSTDLLTPTPTTTRPALIILPSGFTPTAPAAHTATVQPTTQPSDSGAVNPTTPAKICFPPSNYVPYIVQTGDSLESLSKAVSVGMAKLRDSNCLDESSVLLPGDVLYLPFVPKSSPQTAESSSQEVTPTPAVQNNTP